MAADATTAAADTGPTHALAAADLPRGRVEHIMQARRLLMAEEHGPAQRRHVAAAVAADMPAPAAVVDMQPAAAVMQVVVAADMKAADTGKR
jgi:hypothetical protein